MNEPVKIGATYDDLVDLPENVVGEIIDGALYATPRPRVRHALLTGALVSAAHGRFGGRSTEDPGWWILPEPELHFGAQIVVPDIAGWRRARVPVLPDEPWLAIAPDWACEILSPSTARLDRVHKLPIYARAGVGHVWLVDPDARTLEVLRLEGESWVVAAAFGANDRARPEPFDSAEFDLTGWWMP